MSVKLKITLWYTSLMIIVVGLVLLFMSALSGSVAEDNMTTRLENFTEQNSNEVEYSIRYISKTGEILQDLELDDFVEQRSDMTAYIYNSRGELLHGDEEVYFTDLEFVDGRYAPNTSMARSTWSTILSLFQTLGFPMCMYG